MTRRGPALVFAAVIALVLLLAWGIRARITTLRDQTDSALATRVATAAPTVSPPPAPTLIRQRLAGIVLGALQYIIIEQPDGANGLYRPGEEVPGLGRLVSIETSSATFEGGNGTVRLAIAPAATVTAGATAWRTPLWTPPRLETTLERSPLPVRTAGKSSP